MYKGVQLTIIIQNRTVSLFSLSLMPIRIYSLASTNQWVDPCYLVCMYHMLLSRIIVTLSVTLSPLNLIGQVSYRREIWLPNLSNASESGGPAV